MGGRNQRKPTPILELTPLLYLSSSPAATPDAQEPSAPVALQPEPEGLYTQRIQQQAARSQIVESCNKTVLLFYFKSTKERSFISCGVNVMIQSVSITVDFSFIFDSLLVTLVRQIVAMAQRIQDPALVFFPEGRNRLHTFNQNFNQTVLQMQWSGYSLI